MRLKKFALFGNIYQAKKSAHVLRLLSILGKHQAEVYIHKDFYQFLTKDQKMDIQAAGVFEGDDFEADMVLSMGGDGTFLKAASHVGKKNIPILGINTRHSGEPLTFQRQSEHRLVPLLQLALPRSLRIARRSPHYRHAVPYHAPQTISHHNRQQG